MKVEALNIEKISDFIEYCRKHRNEVDGSYLFDENLNEFELNKENPTYIVANKKGQAIAAASLMIDDYHQRGRTARFRIFHSKKRNSKCFHLLLQSILNHTKNLDKIFLFIPLNNKSLSKSVEQLGFSVERYSFLMVRENLDIPKFIFPNDYTIKSFRPGKDEENWCEVRNAGFSNLKGSEAPITPDNVKKMVSSGDYLEGGMKILFHKEKPVGVVRGAADQHDDEPIMNIGPLAILPEYQGKGLGRILLRASLQFARDNLYKRTILSVNGENEWAKELYHKEGFKEVDTFACYQFVLKK
ncbi:GNAT family N-acetyltransferase [Neobacillus cucumis]|uniref:GNAT family N-acetyltransferase n=1 Tax=Neobacillus cucumis TaxID=1740721 RepID=UPI0018DF7434|nr:GNAT family N-acetyltransferase [Neobacillus cucumis]MBI0580845.1 GNAT family N-acetyltransferase [Neobacillus cucumis]